MPPKKVPAKEGSARKTTGSRGRDPARAASGATPGKRRSRGSGGEPKPTRSSKAKKTAVADFLADPVHVVRTLALCNPDSGTAGADYNDLSSLNTKLRLEVGRLYALVPLTYFWKSLLPNSACVQSRRSPLTNRAS